MGFFDRFRSKNKVDHSEKIRETQPEPAAKNMPGPAEKKVPEPAAKAVPATSAKAVNNTNVFFIINLHKLKSNRKIDKTILS